MTANTTAIAQPKTAELNKDKIFCCIGDRFLGVGSYTIECIDKMLWKRRGINEACFRLSHHCYDVTENAYKKLIKDGFTEVSQEDYKIIHGL